MNTKILQKCVEELNKEQPNLSYIKGMLETLIEMTTVQPFFTSPIGSTTNTIQLTPSLTSYANAKADEEEGSGLLAAYTAGLPAQLQ